MRDHGIKFLEAIGKAVGELDAGVLIIPEEVGEAQLVGRLILIVFAHRVGIDDATAPSPPLGQLLHIPVTHLHSLTVLTAALAEPPYHEMRLPSQSLHAEVEPRRETVRVGLALQVDGVCICSYALYAGEIPALEVTPESSTAH